MFSELAPPLSLEKKLQNTSLFNVTLFGKNSRDIYKQKEHALIGISPFNSYFTEERLLQLIGWGLKTFNKITVFLPNQISVFTLMALGYPLEKAEYKTRRQDQYLRNKIFRAFNTLGLNEFDADQSFITITKLLKNTEYQKIYNDCVERFENDSGFKKGCLSTSFWMLKNHLKAADSLDTEKMLLAVQYFLKEMPLFLDTPRILGVKSSLFAYHSIPQYLEYLYHTSNSFVSPHQCYLKVQFDESC